MQNEFDMIRSTFRKNPELLTAIIDISTMGYRTGLIQGKLRQISEDEAIDIQELELADLEEDEINLIISDTEDYYKRLVDILKVITAHRATNRVSGTIEELETEFPFLFSD